jgi:D-3-phosphoglycerate dehydrogenase
VQVARLVSAFGAEVLAWGRETTLARARADGVTCAASREEFFEACDLVSLHLRLTPETRGIVTGEDFARMRRDAIFLNTSRAELVAPGALEAALRKGRPGRAAVDVFEREPVLGASDPLLQLPHCLATPHLGFVERDTYEAYFSAAFDQINEFAARA